MNLHLSFDESNSLKKYNAILLATIKAAGCLCFAFANSGIAEGYTEEELIELLNLGDSRMQKANFKLAGSISVTLHKGFAKSLSTYSPDTVIPIGLKLKSRFEYAQAGEASYQKLDIIDFGSENSGKLLSNLSIWRQPQGILTLDEKKGLYSIPTIKPPSSPIEFMNACFSFVPMLPEDLLFTEGHSKAEQVRLFIKSGSADLLEVETKRAGDLVILTTVENWGMARNAWEGYYHRHQFSFDLAKGGALIKHVDEYLITDPDQAIDEKNATVSIHSDHKQVGDVWIPQKVIQTIALTKSRFELSSGNGAKIRRSPPQLPLVTWKAITYQMNISEVEEEFDQKIAQEPAIEPGTEIFDQISKRYFTYKPGSSVFEQASKDRKGRQ